MLRIATGAASYCLLLALLSCQVSATNPYDPDGTGAKHPGRITGRVYITGNPAREGHSVHILDEADALAAF